jgi:hypothetical protein
VGGRANIPPIIRGELINRTIYLAVQEAMENAHHDEALKRAMIRDMKQHPIVIPPELFRS